MFVFWGLIDCIGEHCLEAAIARVGGFTSVTNWVTDLVYAYVCVCVGVHLILYIHSFTGDANGKESACNAGDLRDTDSIPGSGRSAGEGNGNPLQYFHL